MQLFRTKLKELATVDLFKEIAQPEAFVGHPFYFDFNAMKVLSNDHWKEKVGGIPAGAFLTAVYNNDPHCPEVVLLRVLGPTALPSDSDVVAAMVDHYKENAGTNPFYQGWSASVFRPGGTTLQADARACHLPAASTREQYIPHSSPCRA